MALGPTLAACTGHSTGAPASPSTVAVAPVATTRPGIEGEVIERSLLNAFDCFNRYSYLKDFRRVEVTTKRPCDQSHDAEIFLKENVADSVPAFDTDKLTAIAHTRCYEQFEVFVGKPFETSTYRMEFDLPTPEEWNRSAAGRVVTCFLTGATNLTKLVGSAKQSRR